MPELRQYQVEPCERLHDILYGGRCALDASDTGTGKTHVAACALAHLDCPVGVVCPATVRTAWLETLEAYGVGAILFVNSWEKMKNGSTPHYCAHDVMGRRLKPQQARELHRPLRWRLPRETRIVFDEVHRARGLRTQNSDLVVNAAAQGYSCLALSATASENPAHMRALGALLRLHRVDNFYEWAQGFGCVPTEHRELEFRGTDDFLRHLHSLIYPARGVRVRKADLIARGEFPESDVAAVAYDLGPNQARARAAYEQMERELAAVRDARAEDARRRNHSALTVMLRARQEVEVLKVPTLAELAEEVFDAGGSVAIFTCFDATMDALLERMPDAAVVRGGQSRREREANVAAFQADEVGAVLVNVKAGGEGVSLHDARGACPRTALVCPTFSATELAQALGRVHRAGGTPSTQRIVFAAGTVEEKACAAVRAKLRNLTLLNDGDLAAGIQWRTQDAG